MGIGANSGTLTLAEALKVAFLKGSIHLLASSRPSCWPRWRGGGREQRTYPAQRAVPAVGQRRLQTCCVIVVATLGHRPLILLVLLGRAKADTT